MSKVCSIVLLAMLLTILAGDQIQSSWAFVPSAPLNVLRRQAAWNLPSNTIETSSEHLSSSSSILPSWSLSSHSTSTALRYANGATLETAEEEDVSEFQRRMRKITFAPTTIKTQSDNINDIRRRASNVMMVDTLKEYKTQVADEQDRIVVVRFYADWCRACRAVEPLFYKLARENPSVKFIEVPVTAENSSLHQGLGVPSLPFGHIYHPQSGLVEELRINKREFAHFVNVLNGYVQGSCDVTNTADAFETLAAATAA